MLFRSIGKKRATIANHLRLLRLPAEIQLGLRDRKLDMGHARALLAIDDPKQQLKIYNRILREGLSVRNVEKIVKDLQNPPVDVPERKIPERNTDYDFFARELSNYFPTPVKFTRNASGKGQIVLKFSSDDELQKLVGLFESLKKS